MPFTWTESMALDRAEAAPVMDDERFRILYDRTARPLYGYLRRATGDPALADDLFQETYLRILRGAPIDDIATDRAKHYVFRIAINLWRDHLRRKKGEPLDDVPEARLAAPADRADAREDMGRFLEALKPRERELVWLAYVERFSHEEIAGMLGLKAASIRPMLFRAKDKLAQLLRGKGWV